MKMLIVDDNKENLYLLETMLKGSSYDVASATNGTEALEKLHAQRFDMVISDILMPFMDGFQLCHKVKSDEKLQDILFVFYTATYTDEKDEDLALKLGADKFIRKPVEPYEFIRIIKGTIEDTMKGKIVRQERVVEEKEVLKLYSERLVKKLERKMIDLEREITERKLAEDEIKKSEERYHQLIDNANDAVFVVQDGMFKFGNPKAREFSGYSIEELTSKPFADFIHPDDRQLVLERYLSRLKGEDVPYRYTLRFIDKDKGTRWGEVNVVSISWEGKPAALTFLRDITDLKQAETDLKRSEQKYYSLVEDTSAGIASTDLTGNFTFANRATCQMLGYSQDELLGKSFADYLHPDDLERVAQMFLGAPTDPREKVDLEFKVVSKKGHVADMWASVTRTKEGDQTVGFNAIITDTTERKRLEAEKKQLELKAQATSRLASVGEMTAGVAHEINNPLTAVTGYAQLLMDREDVPSDIRADLAAINDGSQRVASIVKRLLTFSRQTKPEQKLVDINELIESTLVLRAYHLRVNNIEVVTRLAPELLETVVDPGQIQQVLLNLIVNAETEMKLAHGKGKLTITTEKSDNTIKMYVKDDGPGIKPEVMDKMFDPFFTTREVGEGTGLGLSLCYGIVAEHQGRIYAESQPGKGTTFVVELPVVTEVEPLKPAEPVVKKPQKKGKARILVVDDEQVVRDVVNRVLSGEGHKVETVDKAAEALKKVKSQRYNLILLDVKMPGIGGVELYKRIQKIDKSLAQRVVFITGDVMSADTEKFLSEAKVAHIEKPFNAEQLRIEVKRALVEGQ